MKHVIYLLTENHQGVLSRISGLFSGRGYNLESITAGPIKGNDIVRVTLVCHGDQAVIEQIKKQLNKLIDIIKVIDLTKKPSINRELALIKVAASHNERTEILQIVQMINAKIMDISKDSIIISAAGDSETIDDYITIISEYKILEIARSGLVSMERGKKIPTSFKGEIDG